MLSVPTDKLPLIVAIRVAKAEKLVPFKKDSKKKFNTKFRIVIHGGKKPKSSELVEDSGGNPEWGFSCLLKRHKGSVDPISLLVEDSDGHQLGQVVIPLVKLGPKPYTYSPDQSPATSSNLICSELEPTKKNPKASGFLIYWIWVEEYCQEQDTASRSSFKSMTSLFSSKNALGSSKSRLSFTRGSSGNISSGTTLNKPESHKKAHSIFHIKSKKEKSKISAPECNKSPDSSDVESYTEPGNPFETDVNRGIPVQTNQSISARGSDFKVNAYNNPFDSSNTRQASEFVHNAEQDRLDVISGSSNGSIFECDSITKQSGVPEYWRVGGISPITLPPAETQMIIPKSPVSIKDDNKTSPMTLLGKSNLANKQSPTTDQKVYNERIDIKAPPPYQPGHRSNNDSDNSLFADHTVSQQPVTPVKEYQPNFLSMTPVTLPPVDADVFVKPLSKTNEPSKSSVLDKFNEPSTRSGTFQPEIIPVSPYHQSDQRNQPGHKSINSNDFSIFGDQNVNQPAPSSTKVPEYRPSLTSITPVTLPPFDTNTTQLKSPANFKEPNKIVQSPALVKSNQPINQSPFSNRNPFNQEITPVLSKTQFDQRHQPVLNDEVDLLRKENTELKSQHSNSIHRISELQNELDYVKGCLFKLRMKLLEEGATEFLEKL